MSDTPLLPGALPPTNEPLRLAVRRMRWFKQAFRHYMDASGQALGCRFEVDEPKLARVFVRWLSAIDQQKPSDKAQRRDFFEFAAALMLRELVDEPPLRALGPATRAAPDSAAAFWPEGYCCTTFCLSVHAAAMAQEFHHPTALDQSFDDLRLWWSFRENAHHNPAFAAGFLQRLLGHEPNWVMPDVFIARLRREIGG